MRVLHLLTRRPFVRDIGVVRYVTLATALATGLAWCAALWDDAATAVRVATAASVLKDHFREAGRTVRLESLPRDMELAVHGPAGRFTLCSREPDTRRGRFCVTPFAGS